MSADTCITYFGLRYDVGPDEIELLERKRDARQVAAHRAGLKSYWGKFAGHEDRHLLFVGAEVATLGPENRLSAKISPEDLARLLSQTLDGLRSSGLTGEVALHFEWQLDS